MDRFTYEANKKIPLVLSPNLLKVFVKEYSLEVSLIIKYAIKNEIEEFFDIALSLSKDIKINIEEYIKIIWIHNHTFRFKLLQIFSKDFNDAEIYNYLRSIGKSDLICNLYLDVKNLLMNYIESQNGIKTSLEALEIELLYPYLQISNLELYKNFKVSNQYGFDPIHLAIIAGNFGLVSQMIKAGFEIKNFSKNNITSIHLLNMQKKHINSSILEDVLYRVDNIDENLGRGQTLVDVLISEPALLRLILNKTKDPLLYFFKDEVDLFSISRNQTSIAISHGEGFWSTEIWSVARLMMYKYPEIKFYLVNSKMLEEGGELFIKQFDAVINPGSIDSYPRGMAKFSKEDCSFSMILEKHYQNMLDLTYKYNIPYMGICAGSQHFSLYHGGKLEPLENYAKGQHQITFIPGSLAHFQSSNKEQQQKILLNCQFSKITYKGNTAHRFAAATDQLGMQIELGAVSEDNVAMIYAHLNGIRYAVQYHPEHYYVIDNPSMYEVVWFDNFLELAKMHNDYRVHNRSHPLDYMAKIKETLDLCTQQTLQEFLIDFLN